MVNLVCVAGLPKQIKHVHMSKYAFSYILIRISVCTFANVHASTHSSISSRQLEQTTQHLQQGDRSQDEEERAGG